MVLNKVTIFRNKSLSLGYSLRMLINICGTIRKSLSETLILEIKISVMAL